MEETDSFQNELTFNIDLTQNSVTQNSITSTVQIVSSDIPYEEMEFPSEFILTPEKKVLSIIYYNL